MDKYNLIEMLNSILHDSKFLLGSVVVDNKEFRISLDRVYYEKVYKKKMFFIIPTFNYKSIVSVLKISNVDSYSIKWYKALDTNEDDFISYELLEIKINDNGSVCLCCNDFDILINLNEDSKIFLTDTNSISSSYVYTDFFVSVNSFEFEENEKIKNLFKNGQLIKN